MSVKQRFSLPKVCALIIIAVLVAGSVIFMQHTTKAKADGNYAADAAAGMTVLQSYYTAGGLWNTGNDAEWWQSANMLETTIDYMIQSGSSAYSSDISTTFNDNKDTGQASDPSPNFINHYYDDSGWWALAWIKAYDYTGNATYLNMAETIFAYMTGGWDASNCGGGVWWNSYHTYKNAIPNEQFLEIAAELHARAGGDAVGGGGPNGHSYIDWATMEWNWFQNSGMINGSNLINDGLDGSCHNNGGTTWTYNQGVILGGLAALYQDTNNSSYLSEAETLANASTTQMESNGVLQEPCESANNCDQDQLIFKGVYLKNLSILQGVDHSTAYKNFITTNADALWASDRDSNNNFGVHWNGPLQSTGTAPQASGEDLLNAAIPFSGTTPPPNQGNYTSGFESSNPQPAVNTPYQNSVANVGGYLTTLSGPESGAVQGETTHGGSGSLRYSGKAQGAASNYAYMQVYGNLSIAVGANTTLTYWIYPQSSSSAGNVSGTTSTCVAIDLYFSDGSDLRDSGAVDQHGVRVHPAYQCQHLTLDTWNQVTTNLGGIANGKTVTTINLGFDDPGGSGGYRGYVDDLSIG